MIEIRRATEGDNRALIELQTRCPQGTSLILNVDSSPDFFARSKPFKDWTVLVAVDDGRIVGSAGYAISDVLVEGRLVKTAYEYGFMVDPQERRKGIAVKLQECIEQNAVERNVDLLYLNIIEDNVPSANLFSKMGFEKVKECTTLSLMAYKKQRLTKEANIRSAEKSDFTEIAEMINEMYRNYNFFNPFKTEDLLDYLDRMPGFNLHNLFVFQDNQGISACLGYWDYTKVRKYIVERFNWRLRAQLFLMRIAGLFTEMPQIPKPGEPLLSYNLTALAFKQTESIADLVKHVVNVALENRITLLHVPTDMESPVAKVLSQFRHAKVGLQFFVKSLSEKRFSRLGENKLYIDITEM
ncbi:GNAT family N-acetyltransferase [Candidatus Bathyarchaeota archaeon]|nr:GNAT family N-acetyltransferase [Candidatus Bathyarchaeota archaeon]